MAARVIEIIDLAPGALIHLSYGGPGGHSGTFVVVSVQGYVGLWVRNDSSDWDRRHPEDPVPPESKRPHFYPFALTHVTILAPPPPRDPSLDDRETLSVSSGPGGAQVKRRDGR